MYFSRSLTDEELDVYGRGIHEADWVLQEGLQDARIQSRIGHDSGPK